MKVKLRKYQQEAVDKIIEYFLDKLRKNPELISLPTGAGKSFVIAEAVYILKKINKNIKVLALQPSLEILKQNKEKLELYGYKPTSYSASAGEKIISSLTLATIGTIIKQKHLFIDFDFIFIDECHCVNHKAGMYKEFLEIFKNIKCIGLSATPYRLNTNSFGTISKILTRTRPKIFSKFCFSVSNLKMWTDGFLCPIIYKTSFNYDISKVKINSNGSNYDLKSLKKYNKAQNIVRIIHNTILNNKERNHILVFTTFIDEAEEVANSLKNIGIKASAISSNVGKKEREKMLLDFREGRIKVLVNAKILTTGYDFPALDCIVDANSTLSLALNSQKIGRGVRLHPGKKNLLYLDITNNMKKFGDISKYTYKKINGGIDLFCGSKQLTGVDLSEENRIYNTYAQKKSNKSNYDNTYKIITFGKYKGKYLNDPKISINYLNFIAEKFDEGKVKSAFIEEIKRRILK